MQVSKTTPAVADGINMSCSKFTLVSLLSAKNSKQRRPANFRTSPQFDRPIHPPTTVRDGMARLLPRGRNPWPSGADLCCTDIQCNSVAVFTTACIPAPTQCSGLECGKYSPIHVHGIAHNSLCFPFLLGLSAMALNASCLGWGKLHFGTRRAYNSTEYARSIDTFAPGREREHAIGYKDCRY